MLINHNASLLTFINNKIFLQSKNYYYICNEVSNNNINVMKKFVLDKEKLGYYLTSLDSLSLYDDRALLKEKNTFNGKNMFKVYYNIRNGEHFRIVHNKKILLNYKDILDEYPEFKEYIKSINCRYCKEKHIHFDYININNYDDLFYNRNVINFDENFQIFLTFYFINLAKNKI